MRTRWLKHKNFRISAGVVAVAALVLAGTTVSRFSSPADRLRALQQSVEQTRVLDRNGNPLSVRFSNDWNVYDTVPLHAVPEFLQAAFVLSEDKRFYEHGGVDWRARLHALWQNINAMRAVRGASTITEQVVRIVHPRPRTVWSRWLEGWEAGRLENHYNKADILEIYLNQVPYASNRRGLVQAARHYFNRDLDTLNTKEMLALAVLVRAPSRLDLYRDAQRIESSIHRLARMLQANGRLSAGELARIMDSPLKLERGETPARAVHFARQVVKHLPAAAPQSKVRSTLDSGLQTAVQSLLDRRLEHLRPNRVHNGAVLVVDHRHQEVLAWAVAGQRDPDIPGSFIDAVTTPRQPGSSMKPFLYALALEKGWTAATLIDDSPLADSVGRGLHNYRNYSHTFYGPLPLRQALGNSLNIPAVKTAKFVGSDSYLSFLRTLDFHSLDRHPDFYGDGLALGNGEVTLFELVRAYTALANRGHYAPLKLNLEVPVSHQTRRVISDETASLIANILSDLQARRLEFGGGSVLNLPVQTAVKTGTSTDYRDAWAVGFNDRYTVGVWMGNLDQLPMDKVTGSTGPGLVLRGVFAELNRHRETRPLYLSPRLIQKEVCLASGKSSATCRTVTEWFAPGTAPEPAWKLESKPIRSTPRWVQPTPGLQMAMDPRIPDDLEAFEFVIDGVKKSDTVEWTLNGTIIARTQGGRTLWHVQRGSHRLNVAVLTNGKPSRPLSPVRFTVK